MENRLRFLEKLALEDRLYWQLKLDDEESISLAYEREQGWSLTRAEGDKLEKIDITSETLRTQLEAWGVDMNDVTDQLTFTILSQTAYAHMFVAEAEALLGRRQVEEAIDSTKTFLDRLSVAVKEQATNLRLVKD